MFHTFELINNRTGRTLGLTQIGATPEAAANVIKNHNLKGYDFQKDYTLRHVSPEEVRSILEADNYQEILGSL